MQVNWQLFSQKMKVFSAAAKWESGKVSYGQEAKWTETRQHYKIINRVLIILINNINNNLIL